MAMQAVQHGWHVPVKPHHSLFCGVQTSQEIGAADIPHGRLSIQSLIVFAPQELHEKDAEESLTNNTTAGVHETLP